MTLSTVLEERTSGSKCNLESGSNIEVTFLPRLPLDANKRISCIKPAIPDSLCFAAQRPTY